MIVMIKFAEWWEDKGGFFGKNYMLGDDSIEGYIPGKIESLEERTKREVAGIVRLLKLDSPSKVLDVPCGYGRHSIKLNEYGMEVVGLDINAQHIGHAKKTLQTAQYRDSHSLEFRVGDMRHIPQEYCGRFDAVINMFYSFGFFDDQANLQVMQGFSDALKKGGRLLIHTDVSKEILSSGNYSFHDTRHLKKGGLLKIDEEYDPFSQRMHGRWVIVEEDGREKGLAPYDVRIYSKKELEEMMLGCGLSGFMAYGSFDGKLFGEGDSEMILVARRLA